MIRTIMQSLLITKYYVVFYVVNYLTLNVKKVVRVNTTCFPSLNPRNLLS
jgi:hypothetical protein